MFVFFLVCPFRPPRKSVDTSVDQDWQKFEENILIRTWVAFRHPEGGGGGGGEAEFCRRHLGRDMGCFLLTQD